MSLLISAYKSHAHKAHVHKVIALLLLLPFSTIVIGDDISLSALGLSEAETQKEEKIDWSKPIVSRGFGLEETNNASRQELVAQYKSGQVFYFFGEYVKAAEKWLPLLDENFSEAQASMGWMYQAGLGVLKDEKKAFSLYVKAAEQENAVAQNNLGVMYENGITVNTDIKQAKQWYKRSAEQGYRFGQYNYANILLSEAPLGDALSKIEKAKLWLRKSADQGVIQATEKLVSLSKS